MAKWRTDTKEKTVLCKGVAHTVTETVQVCSNCGTEKYEGLDADLWSDWHVKYCPHCGEKITEGINEMNSKKEIYIPPCKFTYDFDYGLRFKRELSQELPDIEKKLSIDELDALIDFVHNKTLAEVTEYLSSSQSDHLKESTK